MHNQKIVQWRREMQRAGIDDPATLDELEGHLREEMERRMEAGATEEEALRGAIEKLGKPEVIREEFAKGLDPAEERLKRRLRRIVAWMCYATVLFWILSLVTSRSYDVCISPSLDMLYQMGCGEGYLPAAKKVYSPSSLKPISVVARGGGKNSWYGLCILSNSWHGVSIPSNWNDGTANWYYSILAVTTAHRYFSCFVGFGRESIGLLVGKPYVLWRDNSRKMTVSPHILNGRTLRQIKFWSAVWCLLVLIPLLPSVMGIRRIGRGLLLVMSVLMLTMLGWELHSAQRLITLFLLPQIVAYLAQGCWLCMRMRRRGGLGLARAEIA